MKLLKLALEGYGRFGERVEFEFDTGLNCIMGVNESGKSTLLAALMDALYTLPSTTAQATRERIHWGHPQGWRLELELELRGQHVRIAKFHPVDEPRKRAEFTLQVGTESLAGDAARTRWEQLWRIPQEVYLATACIRQRELTQIANRNLKSLQQQLRESAVNADLNRILNMIQQERRRVRSHIETQRSRAQEIAARLQSARNAQQQRQSLRERLHQIEAEIADLQPQVEQDEQILQRWRTLQAQQDRLEQLRREADANQRHLEQLEQLERRVCEIETELETQFAKLSVLPNDFKEQIDAAYMRYQDAVRRLHALTVQEQARRVEQQRERGRNQARWGFAALGGALIVASLPLGAVSAWLGAVALVLGLVGIGVALLWRGPAVGRPESEPLATPIQQEVQALWQRLSSLLQEAGYALEVHPQNGAPGEYGAETTARLQYAIQQFSERWNALQARRSELERTRHQIDALQAVQEPKTLRERQRELAVQIVGLQEQIQRDPLAREELSVESLVRLEATVARKRQRLSELQAEQLRCEGALQQLSDGEPADALELEHSRAQQRLTQLESRLRLLETVEQLLTETNTRYLSELSPRLKPRIESHLPTLTLGRYTQASLDENLSLRVHHPERDEMMPVEDGQPAWSAGVLDQLFFACRLGLADALADDVRLPLLLDDPFVHFDAERYRAALELLTRVAQQTQVILFTCRALPEGAWGRVLRL
ncbi:MAG: hypothetical protein CFK49_06365 [Armatimonadetes bacterium JP3_11]|nr:MAG: hypothetical protein CFK49_06365 [Armatimonadetes bacterium JP3_11]RMH09286.1 MAG: hypothetical protein D6697_04025 [Armatimonadota bacterium]